MNVKAVFISHLCFCDILSKNRKGMIVMLTHIVELVLEYLIPVCELMGIFIVAISILTAFATYIRNLFTGDEHDVKVQLASGLAVSLEFKMAAEILKTVLIHNLTELTVLGAVIGLRALMSILIHFEMKEKRK